MDAGDLLKSKFCNMLNIKDMNAEELARYIWSLGEEEPQIWQMVALMVARKVGRLPDSMHNRMVMGPGLCELKREYLEIIGGSDGVG